jgi:hypothetical protein
MPLFHVCKDGIANPYYASKAISCAEAVEIVIWLYWMFAVSISALPYASSQLFMAFQQHKLYVTMGIG